MRQLNPLEIVDCCSSPSDGDPFGLFQMRYINGWMCVAGIALPLRVSDFLSLSLIASGWAQFWVGHLLSVHHPQSRVPDLDHMREHIANGPMFHQLQWITLWQCCHAHSRSKIGLLTLNMNKAKTLLEYLTVFSDYVSGR